MSPAPAPPPRYPAALPALLSALLFGVTTPLAKTLLTGTEPLLIAGLLYAGSGVGLSAWIAVTSSSAFRAGLTRRDLPWLALSIVAGGVLAPALLMIGLQGTDAATASLLLNLEMVLTALIAWVVFREATDARLITGFAFILLGSLLLTWPSAAVRTGGELRALLAIAGACLGWAIDNNLTRKISAGDARVIAAIKGLAAGATSLAAAFALGAHLPAWPRVAATLVLGFAGYGVSLVLFVQSLRQLGTARTGAYFAAAPFIGSLLAVALFGMPLGALFWIALACMLVGVWLHCAERHSHEHAHEAMTHTHDHIHDAHHGHSHATDWDGVEPHTHEHRHEPLRHRHAHFPDLHHRHRH